MPYGMRPPELPPLEDFSGRSSPGGRGDVCPTAESGGQAAGNLRARIMVRRL